MVKISYTVVLEIYHGQNILQCIVAMHTNGHTHNSIPSVLTSNFCQMKVKVFLNTKYDKLKNKSFEQAEKLFQHVGWKQFKSILYRYQQNRHIRVTLWVKQLASVKKFICSFSTRYQNYVVSLGIDKTEEVQRALNHYVKPRAYRAAERACNPRSANVDDEILIVTKSSKTN